VSHRHGGPFETSAARDATVLGLKIGILGVATGPGRLNEGSAQPAIAAPRPTALAFAGALIVTGTDTRPRAEVVGGWESGHIGADLRDNDPSDPLIDTGDGICLPFSRGCDDRILREKRRFVRRNWLPELGF
jgi:hypothetical protein